MWLVLCKKLKRRQTNLTLNSTCILCRPTVDCLQTYIVTCVVFLYSMTFNFNFRTHLLILTSQQNAIIDLPICQYNLASSLSPGLLNAEGRAGMGARSGEGARVGGRPPPPQLKHHQKFVSLYGGLFLTFFPYGGLFATFFSLWGAFFNNWGPFSYFFLHVGVLFCHYGGGELFLAPPPPLYEYFCGRP